MGFHKRWISREQIVNRYTNEGIQSVIDWVNNADAIVSSDSFSSDFTDLMTIARKTTTTNGYHRCLSGMIDREIDKSS
tara:strand:+ start:892 stop:1125 length:234 start_codon:yes stop_codon:yes gene_type:complete